MQMLSSLEREDEIYLHFTIKFHSRFDLSYRRIPQNVSQLEISHLLRQNSFSVFTTPLSDLDPHLHPILLAPTHRLPSLLDLLQHGVVAHALVLRVDVGCLVGERNFEGFQACTLVRLGQREGRG